MPGQPDLKITKETGRKKGYIDIIIEQMQNFIFTFNLDLSVKDSGGTRIENVAVRDKITRLSIKGGTESEIVPDPEIKLLFRTIKINYVKQVPLSSHFQITLI